MLPTAPLPTGSLEGWALLNRRRSTMNRNIVIGGAVAAAVVAAGIGIAVAGSGGGGYSNGSSAKTNTTSGGMTATVQTAQTSLGRVLVDSRGRTLYLFEKDPADMSTCSGSCASIW